MLLLVRGRRVPEVRCVVLLSRELREVLSGRLEDFVMWGGDHVSTRVPRGMQHTVVMVLLLVVTPCVIVSWSVGEVNCDKYDQINNK